MKGSISALGALDVSVKVVKIFSFIAPILLFGFKYVYKKSRLKKRNRIRMSMRILKMTIDPLCMVQQIIRTEFVASVPTGHELVYLDQIVSRQLIPIASQLERNVSEYGKSIRKSLGNDVWKQLDLCLQAVVATSEWHYPIKPYMKLERDSRKALMELLVLWNLILAEKKVIDWGKDLMQKHCSQRGISDMVSLLDIK